MVKRTSEDLGFNITVCLAVNCFVHYNGLVFFEVLRLYTDNRLLLNHFTSIFNVHIFILEDNCCIVGFVAEFVFLWIFSHSLQF